MSPLTAAQKQRRSIEKLEKDPEKHEEYKRKKRENYHAKKILAHDLTSKEKFYARVIWKLRKRNLRQKKKNLHYILDITPPCSPSIIPEQEINYSPRDSPIMPPLLNDTPRRKGMKIVKRNRSKLYKENLKLKEKIEKLRQKCDKYSKRYQRAEKIIYQKMNRSQNKLSQRLS